MNFSVRFKRHGVRVALGRVTVCAGSLFNVDLVLLRIWKDWDGCRCHVTVLSLSSVKCCVQQWIIMNTSLTNFRNGTNDTKLTLKPNANHIPEIGMGLYASNLTEREVVARRRV